MKKILALMLIVALGLVGSASATVSGIIGFDVVPTPGANTKGLEPGTPLESSDVFYVDIVMYRAVAGSYLGINCSGELYLSLNASEFAYPINTYGDHPQYTSWPTLDSIGVTYYQGPGLLTPGSKGFQYVAAVGPVPGYDGFNIMDVTGAQNLMIAGGLPAGASDQLIGASGLGTATLFDHIAIHCTGDGDVTVTVAAATEACPYGMPIVNSLETGWANEADDSASGGMLTIYQVPEPMTMALLGLGGLALIRRRRA